MKHLQFTCSLRDEATPLPHFWEHSVGWLMLEVGPGHDEPQPDGHRHDPTCTKWANTSDNGTCLNFLASRFLGADYELGENAYESVCPCGASPRMHSAWNISQEAALRPAPEATAGLVWRRGLAARR